ncbi:MAG: hypothetical protein CVV41_12240 [Candidatus Riflebacteria bacterium HGW-Riflebacteria-1]|nr:MAG: hypothetical protein CVV41_12240 [Candidatus Riflebacteria bacterium HGW-Riflebacteria-1]
MYCFRCGSKLPPRVVNCPDCDTPQKRRQRYRRRMILGLVIFLAGAVAGSLFDTFFFQGRAWEHSFLGALNSSETASQTAVLDLSSASASFAIKHTPVSPEDMVGFDPQVLARLGDQALATTTPAESSEFQETVAGVINANKAEIASAQPQFEVASDAQEMIEASPSAALPVTTDVPAASSPVPAGRLVYASVDTLEKGDGSNYHGMLARDSSELIFSSNRLKINGKNVYQCFSKKPEAAAKASRVFEWPGNVWTPELTPDGKKIVFSSDSASPEHIFVHDRGTGKTTALTSGDSKNMMSAVSPDGRLVAFASAQKGKANNIWLIGIDGSNLLQLTSSAEDDREPRWSADGSTLYFTRIYTFMKKSHIMKVQLEPLGEAQPVIATERRNWLPDVSPDGSTLVYVRSESEDGSKNRLVVRHLASGEEAVVKPLGEADCLRPIWTHDSSGLVFHATVANSRSLYLARFKRDQQGN